MPRGWNTPKSSPTVRRQRLGVELRRLREVNGLTGDQVVDRVGWPAKSKLSRLENGRSRPDLADVLDLLDLYEVSGRDRDQLVAIARDAGNTRGWLRAYSVMTQRQRGYAELEAGSVRISEYALSVVPGLLQTPDYARLRIASTCPLSTAEPAVQDPELEVAARMARQTILTRSAHPPAYEAIIDEQALTGRSASAEQIAHLCALASLPNVAIRVLPRGAIVGPDYVAHNGFSIYLFADPDDPETVTVETLSRELVLTDVLSVSRYAQVYQWLQSAALDRVESRRWLNGRLATINRP